MGRLSGEWEPKVEPKLIHLDSDQVLSNWGSLNLNYMEYFTRGTDKFYRGTDGQIYLKGDGTCSYKNRLVEGMTIDDYMAATNPRTFIVDMIDTAETAHPVEVTAPTSPPMRDEWFNYECDVPVTKKSKMTKRRKTKATKRHQKMREERSPAEQLVYCQLCRVHHGPNEPCFNNDDWDDDLWNYSYYFSYRSPGYCC